MNKDEAKQIITALKTIVDEAINVLDKIENDEELDRLLMEILLAVTLATDPLYRYLYPKTANELIPTPDNLLRIDN